MKGMHAFGRRVRSDWPLRSGTGAGQKVSGSEKDRDGRRRRDVSSRNRRERRQLQMIKTKLLPQ